MKNIFTFCLLFLASIGFSQCFQIEQILVDACENNNDEGQNEMVRFVVGNNNLSLNNFSVVWPFANWTGLIQNAQTTSKVAQLNAGIQAAGGCGQILQPTNNTLPANSVVILVTGLNFDTTANSFGALNETVYMIFQNNPNITAGHFGNYNASPGLRTLTINFGNNCSDTVTYERSNLVTSLGVVGTEDGAAVEFTSNGVPTYFNNGCVAPVQVFTAEIQTAPTSICAGQSLNLSAISEGFTSVIWSTTQGTIQNETTLNPTLSLPTNVAGNSVTVTFTATNSCGQIISDNLMINISPAQIPTFSLLSSICQGAEVPQLPLSSTNNIAGTWNPTQINNTQTTTYTFTPNATLHPCASTVQFTIEVLVNCAFDAYATALWIDNCETPNDGAFYNVTGTGTDLIGDASLVFPNTNLGVFQQNSNAFFLRGAEVKTFKTGNSDVCGTTMFYRIYETSSAPGAFIPFSLDFFDDCDANAGSFPTGGPCQAGNQKWQRVLNDAQNPINLTNFPVGNYVVEVYFEVQGTFVNGVNPCNDVVIVNNNGANYVATFSIQPPPIVVATNPTFCNAQNGTISISGLTALTNFDLVYTYNNVVQNVATFTSNANGTIVVNNLPVGTYQNFILSSNGCDFVNNQTIQIVNPVITPNFAPVTAICVGETLAALPTTSLNDVEGVWTPALNNQTTTIYTFTPNANQCAEAVELTIVVNPLETPTFAPVAAICAGETLNALPTISENGFDGVWTPALNNQSTTTYTFTPNESQCAEAVELTIVVNPLNITTFDFGNNLTLCSNDDFSLPSVSSNGIEGSWQPNSVDFTQSQTYIFTPNGIVCASDFSLNINIVPPIEVMITQECIDADFTLIANFDESQDYTFRWLDNAGIILGNNPTLIVSSLGTFSLEVTSNGCSEVFDVPVLSTYCDIPKGVSPNNDNFNDTFDLTNFEVANVQIFNRHGREVFQKSNYVNEWIGQAYDGSELPSATYFYLVTFQSGTQKTGWVYLNREE
ncbi:MAG: gliding motility-associated C-terminal domain-containing protein [Flavobacterium sp.]